MLEWPIEFLLVEEVGELLYKYCCGFVSKGITLQPLGDIFALVLSKQSKTSADGIGRVFADLLSIDVKGSSITEMRLWG